MTISAARTAVPAWRSLETQMAVLIAMAVLLGGGGVAYALNNLFVQLAALLVLGLNRERFWQFWCEAPHAIRWLASLSLALPLLQLVPLPPALWQGLAGRELMREALDAAQLQVGWRPLSLDPARTWVAALGLLVPLALLSIGWHLTPRAITRLGWLVIMLGLANFLWGIPQVLSNGSAAVPYPENPMPGVLFGSFANRNSTGLFLVVCLALLLNMQWPLRPDFSRAAKAFLALIFAFGVVLTQSRSAIILAVVIVIIAGLRWKPAMIAPKWIGACMAAALAFTATVAELPHGTRLGSVLDRFDLAGDTRLELWEDAAFSAQHFWPLGAGMGTFDEVFQVDESLEHISPRKAGRAHNDYLELVIEGGAPALLLLLGWILLVGKLAWRARRTGGAGQAGALVLLAIGLQSISDYPLRNEALLTVTALALLMLARGTTEQRE